MEETRITDDVLSANFVDGAILTHADVNKIVDVLKTAINANYLDILSMLEDRDTVNQQLKGAYLSKASEVTLQSNDNMFPSSKQVKNYVDNNVSSKVGEFFSSINGYDPTTTQVLKNINGNLMWVNEV